MRLKWEEEEGHILGVANIITKVNMEINMTNFQILIKNTIFTHKVKTTFKII